MDERYQHPTVAELWTPAAQYRAWLEVSRTVVMVQTERGLIPTEDGNAILAGVAPADLNPKRVRDIQDIERETRHDVAAFLAWWRKQLGPELARYTHLGLTSSDLVDTALGLRFAGLEYFYLGAVTQLERQLDRLVRDHAATPLLGFTHGQPAEPTTLGIRAQGWYGMVLRSTSRLSQAWSQMLVAKLSGPVGTYAHNDPEVERLVALRLWLTPHGPGATQVIPRDRLAHWASCAAQVVQVLAKIGVDLRLMARRAEVTEGWPPGRIGSSAMPHKTNPVTAEQLSGMARLAAGYASMLQPVDLWEERDISHSSVERVAVPDLLHVLFHSLRATADLLADAVWDTATMADNLDGAGRLPYTAWRMRGLQAANHAPDIARKEALRWAHGQGMPLPPTPDTMVRNHPLIRDLTREQLS